MKDIPPQGTGGRATDHAAGPGNPRHGHLSPKSPPSQPDTEHPGPSGRPQDTRRSSAGPGTSSRPPVPRRGRPVSPERDSEAFSAVLSYDRDTRGTEGRPSVTPRAARALRERSPTPHGDLKTKGHGRGAAAGPGDRSPAPGGRGRTVPGSPRGLGEKNSAAASDGQDARGPATGPGRVSPASRPKPGGSPRVAGQASGAELRRAGRPTPAAPTPGSGPKAQRQPLPT